MLVASSCYFPPIDFFISLCFDNELLIDEHEHYVKQSFRNRFQILSANGILNLSVPISKDLPKTPMNEVRINYQENWQKLHWKALESAYNKSPYFEFYKDELADLFQEKHDLLVDLNRSTLAWLLKKFKLKTSVKYSNTFVEQSVTQQDLRSLLSPKKPPVYKGYQYIQVFEDRFAFAPNLSALDILFSGGPNSLLHIAKQATAQP